MVGNIINVGGKEFNLDNMSDEKIVSLYRQLKEREMILEEKIAKYDEEIAFLSEEV